MPDSNNFRFLHSRDGLASVRKGGLNQAFLCACNSVYKCREHRNLKDNQYSQEMQSQISKGTLASTVNMGESQNRAGSRGGRIVRGAKSAHRIQQSTGIFSSDTVIQASEDGNMRGDGIGRNTQQGSSRAL